MFTLLLPILIAAFVIRRLVRPYRPYGRHYNPYGYTRRRRHGGWFALLGLIALDRLFSNRRP